MPGLTVKKLATLVPASHVVTIPEKWFSTIPDNRSAFECLYQWLIESGHVEKKRFHVIHNCVYAGKGVMKRLLAAERNRIARKWNLTGEALDRALAHSDVNSGPLTAFADQDIVGNHLIVLPDGEDVISEARQRIWSERRDRNIKKFKELASGANFWEWLIANEGRDDPVGDLAGDAIDDPEFPKDAKHFQELFLYLERVGGSWQALGAVKDAWTEYAGKYPERVLPTAWCYTCDNIINDPREGVLTWEDEEFRIRHRSCLSVTPDRVVGLQDVLGDAPRHERMFEFAKQCTDSDTAISELETTFRLWGFVKGDDDTFSKIYFIQQGTSGPIKIGHTTSSVEKRLSDLQTAHHQRLRVLATLDGDRSVEQDLHNRFRKYRKTGEWFEPHPDLIAFIATICAGPRRS